MTHVVVSSAILALAMMAAAWIRPLTARTRHAILIIGMAALALPAPLLARLFERNEISMTVLGGPAVFNPPAMTARLKPDPTSINLIAIVWLAVAAILLVRWWIITRRLVKNALNAATPPPRRSFAALDSARRRLSMTHGIDLIASPMCEAPAVVRVLRPLIILPADGCDALDDEELESLLCHECAHVARRDNLLGVLEAVVCSLFWFNPLVWLAHRRIAAAREAACDERVADAALPAGTYAGALAKLCRTLIAPRIPAVSCMASAHVKERIRHLMSYETIRKSAFSHRVMAASSMFAVILTVGLAGMVLAKPITLQHGDYRVDYSMNMTEEGLLAIRARLVNTKTGKVVGEPSTTTEPGQSAIMRFGHQDANSESDYKITVHTNTDGSGELTLVVTENGRVVQDTVTSFPTPGKAPAPQYAGRPISLQLSKADLRDVLDTFAQLTETEIVVAPNVKGTVNVNIVNMPWDQAFDQIIREQGFSYRIEGKRIEVFRP